MTTDEKVETPILWLPLGSGTHSFVRKEDYDLLHAELERVKGELNGAQLTIDDLQGVLQDFVKRATTAEADAKRWWSAASPYATPEALKEGLEKARENEGRCKHEWTRAEKQPPKFTCSCGTVVYRSYEDYVDD